MRIGNFLKGVSVLHRDGGIGEVVCGNRLPQGPGRTGQPEGGGKGGVPPREALRH